VKAKLTLDRTLWRRVRLNATASFGFSNSQLSYYWSWDDERKNTVRAQENIELPYSAVASVLIPTRGSYKLVLWVTDGCETASVSVVIEGTCAEVPLDFMGTGAIAHTYVVPQEDAVVITTFELKERSACPSDNWTLVDFVASYVPVQPDDGGSSAPSAGATVGIVFGVLAGVGVLAAGAFCYVKRRGASGGRPARDIYAPGLVDDRTVGSDEHMIGLESGRPAAYDPPAPTSAPVTAPPPAAAY